MCSAQYRTYTDAELLRFVENNPGHLEAEGELVRRVVVEEFGTDLREHIAELEHDIEMRKVDSSTIDSQAEDIEKLECRIAELEAKLAAVREAAEDNHTAPVL